MKRESDLHLIKKADKRSLRRIRNKGMEHCLAVFLSVVLVIGSCIPAMAAEEPQIEDDGSAAADPIVEATAEETAAAATEEGSSGDNPDRTVNDSTWLDYYNYEINGGVIVLLGGSCPDQTDYTVPGSAVIDGETYHRIQVTSSVFWNCKNLSFDQGVEFPSGCAYLFSDETSLESIDFTNIDTSNVENMGSMFEGCTNLTELELGGFNTSNVNIMEAMFKDCSSLTELDLSGFDASKVYDMNEMFKGCSSLTELDLSGFGTSSAMYIEEMFYDCNNLSYVDLSSWDLSAITDNCVLTNGAVETIEAPLNVSTNVSLGGKYQGSDGNTYVSLPKHLSSSITLTRTESGTTEDTSPWLSDYEFVIDGDKIVLTGGYLGTETDVTVPGTAVVDGEVFERVQITGDIIWNCEKLSFDQGVEFPDDSSGLFAYKDGLKSIDFTNIDTSNVTDMSGMFDSSQELTKLNLSGFDTSNVTDMSYMFNYCTNLTGLDIRGFDTSNVTDMSYMFDECQSLTKLDVTGFVTSSVNNMNTMFWDCASLKELDVSRFDTSNVTDMMFMFGSCLSLKELDVSGFDVSNVEDVGWMFYGCENLYQVDLSGWDLSSVVYESSLAEGELEIIKAPLGVNVEILLGDSYYGSDGNIYEYLPRNLTKSITLAKDETDLPVEPVEFEPNRRPVGDSLPSLSTTIKTASCQGGLFCLLSSCF